MRCFEKISFAQFKKDICDNVDLYNEYELPTYTISAIKEYDNYFEVYLLCDCLVSIWYKNKTIENIEDNRFDKIKFECRKEISKIDKLDLDIEAKLKLKRPIWREYRKYANKENGYPVGSTNKNSIEQGIIKRIKIARIKPLDIVFARFSCVYLVKK